MLRRLAALLGVSLCFTALHAAPDCGTRPTWCVAGYTCEPTGCTARSTIALERLGAELIAARAQRPRWFRPFIAGGGTWSAIEGPGFWAEGGVMLWRLQASATISEDDTQARVGFRREW
jgi:hypothetical protein